jgi:hypothetical protein
MNDNTAGIAPDADAGAAPVEGQVSVEKVTIPMPFVVIATPSLHHSCSLAHRDSMLEIRGVLIEKGVPHAFISVAGKCPPDLARDTLVTMFLEDFPAATDLFFVDDDVGGRNLGEVVLQFLIRAEPILVGAPPERGDPPAGGVKFPIGLVGSGEGTLTQNVNGALKLDYGPMGFCRIKRAVLEQLVNTGQAVRYRDPDSGRQLWHLFSCGVAAGADGELTYWGEDNVFYRRAIGAGIEVWLEPNITFSHSGRKRWDGNLLRELLKRGAQPRAAGIKPDGLVPYQESPAAEVYPKFVHGQIAESAEDEARILAAAAAGAGEGQPVSAATLPAEGEEAAAGSAPAAAEGASL